MGLQHTGFDTRPPSKNPPAPLSCSLWLSSNLNPVLPLEKKKTPSRSRCAPASVSCVPERSQQTLRRWCVSILPSFFFLLVFVTEQDLQRKQAVRFSHPATDSPSVHLFSSLSSPSPLTPSRLSLRPPPCLFPGLLRSL